MDLVRNALERGQSALTEYEAKRFLSARGIPVAREALSKNPTAAVREAVKIGFPVVLKASGPNLLHKTEIGGVALNLKDQEEVKNEGKRLLRIEGCEALLIQEMVKGEREFVCGMTRHDSFGPCVMFGLGGIFTEVFEDISFRLAPVSLWDARQMIEEVRAKKILDPFRGEQAVDRESLARILVALGDISVQVEHVEQIDLNPVKIRSTGQPVAVDALVILKKAQS
jgi:acetate---CoA ligase (ADP-forming) subunit beta